MPEERPQIPPPRFAVREFQTPNFADGFYSEVFKRTDPAYLSFVVVPKRGTLYSTIPGANNQVIALFPNLYFLKETRFQSSHEWVIWIWATDPLAEDSYNARITYTNECVANPIYERLRTVRRDVYENNPTIATLTDLTSLVGVTVGAGGTGYTKATGTTGTGATITFICANGQIIAGIVTASGTAVTSGGTIAITGDGTGATATAITQPTSTVLIAQKKQEFPEDSPFRWEYVQVLLTYETFPGPILYDIVPDSQLDVPMMTTEQRRAATDTWTNGLIAPIAFGISAATIAAQTVITLSGYPTIPDIFKEEWLVVAGTANTTPSLNGTWQVAAVNGNLITLNKALTGVSGAVGGTAKRYSYAFIERRKTENANVVMMVTRRAITDDITTLNQSVSPTYIQYAFPDALIGIFEYLEEGTTDNLTDPVNYAFSFSGGVGFLILPGFRGACKATRLWVFSMGPAVVIPDNPDTSLPYAPTIVIPAVGTVTVKTGSKSQTVNLNSGSPQIAKSNSNGSKGVPIPPVLTSAYTGPIQVGVGQATFSVALPSSIIQDDGSAPRAGWEQGDIITEFKEIEKLQSAGVYLTEIRLIEVPYTTGQPRNGFVYLVSPASYPIGSGIATNTPQIGGASGFAITPALANGLAIDATTGNITGVVSGSATAQTYTITCTKGGLTYTAYLTIVTF